MTLNNDLHALYATSPEGVCFRIGQPVDWDTAIRRHTREVERAIPKRVRHMRRKYTVKFFEVRATDRHGRGLGSERHAEAITLPARKLRVG